MKKFKLKKPVAMLGCVIAVVFSNVVAMADSMGNMSGMSSKQPSMNHQKKKLGNKSMMAHPMEKKMSMKPGKGNMSSMTNKSHSSVYKDSMMQQ
jgi:hypothetical protein